MQDYEPFDTSYLVLQFGLENVGSICWCNALFQCLFSLPAFNKTVLQVYDQLVSGQLSVASEDTDIAFLFTHIANIIRQEITKHSELVNQAIITLEKTVEEKSAELSFIANIWSIAECCGFLVQRISGKAVVQDDAHSGFHTFLTRVYGICGDSISKLFTITYDVSFEHKGCAKSTGRFAREPSEDNKSELLLSPNWATENQSADDPHNDNWMQRFVSTGGGIAVLDATTRCPKCQQTGEITQYNTLKALSPILTIYKLTYDRTLGSVISRTFRANMPLSFTVELDGKIYRYCMMAIANHYGGLTEGHYNADVVRGIISQDTIDSGRIHQYHRILDDRTIGRQEGVFAETEYAYLIFYHLVSVWHVH